MYFSGHLIIFLVNSTFWLGLGKVCKKIVRIGGGIDVNEESKKKRKTVMAETGVPLEVDNGVMDIKKEE